MPTSSKQLKIGFVLDDGLDKPDGVQQYILAIGGWLESQGHQVRYLVGQTSRDDLPNVYSMSRNMRVRFNGNSLSMPLPTRRAKLRRVLDAEKFDVLHIQVPYSPFMGHQAIMAAGRNTAIIGTFHIAPNGWLSRVGNHGLGIWLRRSLKRFDKMVSVSVAAAEFASDTFHVSSEISPNVIDYKRFHEAKPLQRYRGKDPVILFLGRLVPRKGCLQLLKAVRDLGSKADSPGFRVIICGTGPLEQQLRQYMSRHKMDDFVEFTGFVTEAEKPRYYASADIAVFPSSGGESFGIVLLEAMASGKAAILAGDNAGYRSVLVSRPELLINPDDSRALSKRLAAYLHDQDFRREVAAWGGNFARDYDVNKVGRHLLKVYEEALRKRRKQ
jgi:phosphatidylinositol alpha-mannosyltransferase